MPILLRGDKSKACFGGILIQEKQIVKLFVKIKMPWAGGD
jgi:hypothetical protein